MVTVNDQVMAFHVNTASKVSCSYIMVTLDKGTQDFLRNQAFAYFAP